MTKIKDLSTDRHKFVGNFLTENFIIYLDNEEVDILSSGGWSDLSTVMDIAEEKVIEKIPAGRKIANKYINIKRNQIHFWTFKNGEWFTL